MRIRDWSSDVCSSDLSVEDISEALQTPLGSRRVSTYTDRGEEYRVIMQAEKEGRETISDLGKIYVRSSAGGLVTLSSLVTVKEIAGPQSDRKSTRLNSSHYCASRMPTSAQKTTHHTP